MKNTMNWRRHMQEIEHALAAERRETIPCLGMPSPWPPKKVHGLRAACGSAFEMVRRESRTGSQVSARPAGIF